jgi:hypothetical protein
LLVWYLAAKRPAAPAHGHSVWLLWRCLLILVR